MKITRDEDWSVRRRWRERRGLLDAGRELFSPPLSPSLCSVTLSRALSRIARMARGQGRGAAEREGEVGDSSKRRNVRVRSSNRSAGSARISPVVSRMRVTARPLSQGLPRAVSAVDVTRCRPPPPLLAPKPQPPTSSSPSPPSWLPPIDLTSRFSLKSTHNPRASYRRTFSPAAVPLFKRLPVPFVLPLPPPPHAIHPGTPRVMDTLDRGRAELFTQCLLGFTL